MLPNNNKKAARYLAQFHNRYELLMSGLKYNSEHFIHSQ